MTARHAFVVEHGGRITVGSARIFERQPGACALLAVADHELAILISPRHQETDLDWGLVNRLVIDYRARGERAEHPEWKRMPGHGHVIAIALLHELVPAIAELEDELAARTVVAGDAVRRPGEAHRTT